MLKTFNVVEKYESILPFLESKKNQSSYICELILREMNEERISLNMEALNQQVMTSMTEALVTIQEKIQKEIRDGIRNEIREEVRSEIRTELRSELRDFKRQFFEDLKIEASENMRSDAHSIVHVATGRGYSGRNIGGRLVKEPIEPDPTPRLGDLNISV